MCSARAEHDAHFVRDVCFASDVRFVCEDAEHITSLRQRRNITIYKIQNLWYNEKNDHERIIS